MPSRFSSTSMLAKCSSRRRFISNVAVLGGVALLPSASLFAQQNAVSNVRALAFDVFGTVVDWRGSIIREGQILSASKGLTVDWADFADRWRRGYGPAMNRVRSGELPWTTIDELHRMILDDLLVEFELTSLNEQERDALNKVWHRLMPWSDTVSGLNRLKTKYVITTLSNGNVSLLTNMAKNAGLPWDAILSAELAGHYKPAPEAYQKAADLLDLPIEQVMMVATHPSDLRAAARTGMRTAYVDRPLERGPDGAQSVVADGDFDVMAADFLDLADQLGA
ncbi:MAG: haloacid dehalogenase type II [Gammaproteobacteria bacterium]